MDVPEIDVKFIENIEESVKKRPFDILYDGSYTIQPDIPAWIDTTTSLTRQIYLIDYENDLFLTKQLKERIYKEVFRISGEVIRENFKQALTQNWFWASNENLIELLKGYKTIPDNTVTQASLLQNIQNIPFRGEQ